MLCSLISSFIIVELIVSFCEKCSPEIEFKTHLFIIHTYYLVSFSEQVEKISELLLSIPNPNFVLVIFKLHHFLYSIRMLFVNSGLSCTICFNDGAQRATILCPREGFWLRGTQPPDGSLRFLNLRLDK